MTDEFDQADEYDEVSPTGDVPDEPAQDAPPLSGPDDWPEAARMEVAKLRKENAKYRLQRREVREAALVQSYGEQAVAMIPAEVTDPARREEIAANFAETLGGVPPKVPAGLAAVASAPSSSAPSDDSMTMDEFNELVKEVGLTQAAMQHGHRLNIENNPLRDKVARPTQGQYKPPS